MKKTRSRWLDAFTLIFCLAQSIGSAEAQTPPTKVPAQDVPVQAASAERLNGFMPGIHYGVPLKWSAVLGVALPGSTRNSTTFVAGEPGIGGWRASVGYVKMTSELGSGYVARATLLRTNSKAWRAASQSTFAGAEFQLWPLFAIGARVGGFFRIGGQGKQRGLLTADFSLLL
ncbi:MAG TPA: hypothetical protein VII30_06745 [Gemmatimonadaceae bacterium]